MVPRTETPNATVDLPPAVEWWAELGDAGLSAAVTRALHYNRDLAAAASRISSAEAQARIARAGELPTLDAGFSQGRNRTNFVGLPIPGREGSVLTSTTNVTGLAMNLSWEPDVWGKVSSSKAAAMADIEIARANLVAARLSLAGQTAKAWFAAVNAQLQIRVARATVENYRVSLEAARTRQAGGVRSGLDVEATLADLKRAEAIVEMRRRQHDAAVRQLEILMGAYPGGEQEIAEDLPPPPAAVPEGLISESLHRRPDLVAAEAHVVAADARVAQARAHLRPSFRLTGIGGTLTNTLDQILDGRMAIWSLLGGVAQPIFDHGRLKNVVRQQESGVQEAAARYESALLRAYGEVEIAVAGDAFLAQQEQALEEAAKRALTAQNLALEQYRGGMGDAARLLATQRAALELESAWLDARRARLDNRIDLYLALGGEFQIAGASESNTVPQNERTGL